jgi:putative ABC transport system permease protein
MKSLLRIAWRNIGRHWRYSLGAFLSVAVGFLSLTLFRGYMVGVERLYSETYASRMMFGNVLIENGKENEDADDWQKLIPKSSQNFLDTWLKKPERNVKHVVRFLVASGLVSNGVTNTIFWAKGYDISEGGAVRGQTWDWDVVAGEPLSKFPNTLDSIVIGRSLAQILGCEIPVPSELYSKDGGYLPEARPFQCPEKMLQLSVTTAHGQNNAVDGNVVGIVDGMFKEIDTKLVMTNLGFVQKLFDTDGVSQYAVELMPGEEARFLEDLKRDSSSAKIPLLATRWQDHEEGDLYRRTMDLLGVFRNFVVTIMIVITGLSVFNTFLKVVSERSKEIGTFRSLGFRRTEIAGLFLTEGMLLATAGVVAGAGLSILSSVTINSLNLLYKAGMLSEPIPFQIAYVPSLYFSGTLFLLFVSALAALTALSSTLNKPITENMAYA